MNQSRLGRPLACPVPPSLLSLGQGSDPRPSGLPQDSSPDADTVRRLSHTLVRVRMVTLMTWSGARLHLVARRPPCPVAAVRIPDQFQPSSNRIPRFPLPASDWGGSAPRHARSVRDCAGTEHALPRVERFEEDSTFSFPHAPDANPTKGTKPAQCSWW
jgi:hypothetical protein